MPLQNSAEAAEGTFTARLEWVSGPPQRGQTVAARFFFVGATGVPVTAVRLVRVELVRPGVSGSTQEAQIDAVSASPGNVAAASGLHIVASGSYELLVVADTDGKTDQALFRFEVP